MRPSALLLFMLPLVLASLTLIATATDTLITSNHQHAYSHSPRGGLLSFSTTVGGIKNKQIKQPPTSYRIRKSPPPSSAHFPTEYEDEMIPDRYQFDRLDHRSSRRQWLLTTGTRISTVVSAANCLMSNPAMVRAVEQTSLKDTIQESRRLAVRPTAYRVDSTIPPTLIPLGAMKQKAVLVDLAKGLGTDKDIVVVDNILNLNNILNKAVFGSIQAVSTVFNPDPTNQPGASSFICFGVGQSTQPEDIDLVQNLMSMILQVRRSSQKPTALGLSWVPYSCQGALDRYRQQTPLSASSRDLEAAELELFRALEQAGTETVNAKAYLPLLRYARREGLDLLAMAPEPMDIQTVRRLGLSEVDMTRRGEYVVDPQGFIALTQDARFKLYTDRSLLKDFIPSNSKQQQAKQQQEQTPANFFSERILVHEAGATAVARYATQRPGSLVAIIAPIADLRYMGGINGRIPRICEFLNPNSNVNRITNNAVTTVLINPTAEETLSKSRFLRLEIGTTPETLDYQTKVADYIWFSSSPLVNLIPRLMEG